MYKRYTDFFNASRAVRSIWPEAFDEIKERDREIIEIIESVRFK